MINGFSINDDRDNPLVVKSENVKVIKG